MKPVKPSLHPPSWLSAYGDYLFSFCMMRVNNRETAEDLVQETFVAALRANDNFKGESTELTWLVSILRNKIIDHYRKKDILKNAQSYLTETGTDFTKNFFDPLSGHWLNEAAPQPWAEPADELINQAEFDRVLQACVHKMPPRLVPVFVARFFDEEDSETICKVHNLSASNYWVIIHRAKVLMRSCLEKNWFTTKT